MKDNKIIVAFHVGRGGRFNNQGHKSYIGEKDFQDLLNLNDANLFIYNRDWRTGKFITPFIADCNGNAVSDDNINSLTGCLNWDNDYNTDYCQYIEECSEDELEIIAKDSNIWKSFELRNWMEENTEYRFDSNGFLIEEEEGATR